ncbi:MAG: exo-beta-N-acetylmuramidase NamZ family protein [Candidatus Kariarchaeaceae archaeon]
MPKESTELIFTLGIDNFIENYLDLVQGKSVGLLTNPSGVNGNLRATSDILHDHHQVNLNALFGPEHGIRGVINAGEKISTSTDQKTGLPVYSLYGKTRKPSAEMLRGIDIILVDIQDIGLRAYTYIYTMAKVMEAAAENAKQVIVLDRPNPLGGERVEGNLVEKDYFSFVGLFPIPYQHGMTIGELALLFNSEYNINCNLVVIPMRGWKREMLWDETGLDWIPTSPHLPHWQSIFYMGATGTFGELGVLSEGVGYTSPFEIVGAPWIDGEEFSSNLNRKKLPGVYFRSLYFKPYYAHYAGQICQGVQLHITDPSIFQPYSTGLHIMQTHMKLYPEKDLFSKKDRVKMFEKVVGTNKIRKSLIAGLTINDLKETWLPELEKFSTKRAKYLLY